LAAYIQARDVNVTFRPPHRAPVRALAHFDIDVGEGEFLSIVGPSGCGKSTFLNVLLGLLRPDSGDLTVDGRRISGPGADRAMVFQEFGLLPWRTVQGNVELGLELKRVAVGGAHRGASSRWWASPASRGITRTSSRAA
jgi:NitT/TauT family transport system ATP-binding protein